MDCGEYDDDDDGDINGPAVDADFAEAAASLAPPAQDAVVLEREVAAIYQREGDNDPYFHNGEAVIMRTDESTRELMELHRMTKSKQRAAYFGARYSALSRLPYYDVVTGAVVDVMHCFFLVSFVGLCARMYAPSITNLWIDSQGIVRHTVN